MILGRYASTVGEGWTSVLSWRKLDVHPGGRCASLCGPGVSATKLHPMASLMPVTPKGPLLWSTPGQGSGWRPGPSFPPAPQGRLCRDPLGGSAPAEVWVRGGLLQGGGHLVQQCIMGPFEGACQYFHYLHHSLGSGQTTGREHRLAQEQKIGFTFS